MFCVASNHAITCVFIHIIAVYENGYSPTGYKWSRKGIQQQAEWWIDEETWHKTLFNNSIPSPVTVSHYSA